jgi:hypothetical protein
MRFLAKLFLLFIALGNSSHASAGEREIKYVIENIRVGSEIKHIKEKYSTLKIKILEDRFVAYVNFSGKGKFSKLAMTLSGPNEPNPNIVKNIYFETTLPSKTTVGEISSILRSIFGDDFQKLHDKSGNADYHNFYSYFWGDGCLLPRKPLPISGVTKHVVFGKSWHVEDNYLLKFEIQDAAFQNPVYKEKERRPQDARRILENLCKLVNRRNEND